MASPGRGSEKRGGYVKDVHVRDSILSRFLTCAVKYNDDGEGSDVPPVFSDFSCEGVRMTGWARDFDEKEDHAVPGIDLSGFDETGFEAKNMRFTACALPPEGIIRLRNCENIQMDIRRTESSEEKSSAFSTD